MAGHQQIRIKSAPSSLPDNEHSSDTLTFRAGERGGKRAGGGPVFMRQQPDNGRRGRAAETKVQQAVQTAVIVADIAITVDIASEARGSARKVGCG